jgi:mannitol/fructose-specific phosphotransferase system IIA component (Ntr-type)
VVAALGRSRQGIAFDSLDGEPVTLVFLLLVPQGQLQKHLNTVGGIARLLHQAEFRRALEQAPNAEAILRIIQHQQTIGSL